jgi:hypothetical protein
MLLHYTEILLCVVLGDRTQGLTQALPLFFFFFFGGTIVCTHDFTLLGRHAII